MVEQNNRANDGVNAHIRILRNESRIPRKIYDVTPDMPVYTCIIPENDSIHQPITAQMEQDGRAFINCAKFI